MKFDITALKNLIEDEIEINTQVSFPKEDIEKAEMIDVKEINVKGSIRRYNQDEYNVILKVDGTIVLPCALTLQPVDYNIKCQIDEIFSENADENSKKIKNFENSIDILPIVWENILMEIPMRVVSPNASLEKTEGDGWKFIDEDSTSVNPEFEKLNKLFEKKEV